MYIEIRDRLTCIPALVTELRNNPATRQFGMFVGDETGPYLLLTRLANGESKLNPYDWYNSTRTMKTAHEWLLMNWPELRHEPDGMVVDVEFINGETNEPKEPELRW